MTSIHSLWLLVTLVACAQKEITNENNNLNNTKLNTMSHSEWAAGVCAPYLYPIQVYRGDFYTEDNWEPIPNGGIVEDGWGDNGMNMGRSDIIPTGFRITYFSYMENKFYKGDFALPADRIRSLFKEGMIGYRSKRYSTYDAMIVGMASGGVLVVWMQGVDKQVEIGRYQATEIDFDWELFMSPNKKDRTLFVTNTIQRRPEAVANFQKNGLMLGLWDTYRVKYSWRPKFEFPKGSKVEGFELRMYNAEYNFIWGDELAKNSYEKRAITKSIDLLWADETGQDFGADIYFDEAEIFEAYKLIYRDDKEQNAELVIKYNDTRTSLEFYLRSKSEEIELEKTKVKIFKRTK